MNTHVPGGAPLRLAFIKITLAGLWFGTPSGVLAENAADEAYMEEVVVTAQRRDERITDVPVSIGVLSSEQVEAFGVNEVNELALVSPSLTLNGSSGVAGEGFKIRGVGGSTLADGIEQSVSVLVDEVVTGSSGSGLLEFWDIQRIELLRGPQGTLFGKNASAGVVSIVNNDPGDELEAGVSMDYSPKYEDARVDFYVGGPVNDQFGLRVSGFYADRGEGYIDNPVTGKKHNDGDRWGLRLKGSWQGEAFSLDGSVEISEQDKNCCARTFSYVDPDTAGQSALSNLFLARIAANGIQPDIGLRENISDAPITHTNDVVHVTLKPTWTLDSGAQIRSITGYRTWEQRAITDSDMLDVDLANRFDLLRDMKVFSQEVQWLSAEGGPTTYILGAYFFRQWFDVDADLGTGTFLTGGVPLQTLQETEVDSENAALYGHVTVELKDAWTAFAGARLIRDEIEADFTSNGTFFFFPTGLREGRASESDTNWAATAGLRYAVNDDVMVYGAVSRGYKGPAIDVSISGGIANPGADPTLDPEIVANYELGLKGTFLDNRLRLNAVAFYSEVDDFQATAFDPQTATFVLSNAGQVSTQGLELDVTWVAARNLDVYLNIAYTDATFDEFEGVPCTVPQALAGSCSNAAGGQDLSGEPVNQTPEWAVSLGGRLDFSVAGAQAYLRADAAWQDEIISDLDLDPNTRIPAYWVANFEVGVNPAPGFRVALWVRNAFDEDYTNRILDAAAFSGGYAHFPAIDRQAGLTLEYAR